MTTTERDRQPDFLDMVRDLTRGHEHREQYTAERRGTSWTAYHPSRVPALVQQLLGAAPSGTGEMSRSTPQSRPAARIEALDTIMAIDDEAARWVRRLGEDDPGDQLDRETRRPVRGSGTIACITMLAGLHPQVPHCRKGQGERSEAGRWCCPRHELESDVRHWWHQARIITGWDTAAFRPHNSCPVCEQRDSLRIKADAALCVECRSIWAGADQLNVLARHIRAENHDDQASA